MKISLSVSGHVRTLLYKFHENLHLIKNTLGDVEIDVFYSFWDDYSRYYNINDPWHYEAKSFSQPEITKNLINEYFLSNGASKVDGEIESVDVMNRVMEKSPFSLKHMSSQYYKKNRVIENYYSDDYDYYVYIRPDLKISNFPTREHIEKNLDKKSIDLCKYFWFNGRFNGRECNEMIWCGSKNVFKQFTQIHLYEESISKQIDQHHGELVTGMHLKNLVNSGIIDTVTIFDFDYRVIR